MKIYLLTLALSLCPIAGASWSQEAATEAKPTVTSSELFLAAERGDFEMIEAAIDAGLDLNEKSPNGMTAWHLATQKRHVQLAKFLTSHGADPNIAAPSAPSLAHDMLSKIPAEEAPGVSVLVARDGQIVFEECLGLANIKREEPITFNSQFRIGSVTKQFTAAAILKLHEDGKLTVDDKLSKYFKSMPRADEVTLRQLLTHTSGIQSYTSKPMFALRVIMPIKPETLVEEIGMEPFDFEPGERWVYCNSGYFLLGEIVKQVSGTEYEKYLEQSFFKPQGMNATGVYSRKEKPTNDSRGYGFINGKYRPAKNWNMTWAGGAGNLYSTARDLYRWNEGIFNGNLLSENSIKSAHTPGKLNDGSQHDYGFGWSNSKYRGMDRVSHNGGLDGYTAHLARFPEHNTTIVVLANAMPTRGDINPDKLGAQLAEIFLWEHMPPRPPHRIDKSVDVTKLDGYLGNYDYGSKILTVTREGGQLYAQLTDQQRFAIYPESRSHFFLKVVDAEIDFHIGETGRATHVTHHQNDRTFDAQRLEELTDEELTEDYLDSLVGKYDYPSLGVLTITRKEKQLFAQMTAQPKLKIFPVTKTLFKWKAVAAKIRFSLDENGRVIGGTHYQGGQELKVSKVLK